MKMGRNCPFCRDVPATIIHDTTKARAEECPHCGALGWITKSTTGNGWWYHGWQQLDRDLDVPGDRIDGDAVRKAAPMVYLRWAGLATEGNLDALTFA
jgi:hypothetical protein